MTVRCKMKLSGVKKYDCTWSVYDENGNSKPAPVPVVDLEFYVVNRGSPGSENQKFFASTPSGNVKFSTVNLTAADELIKNLGKEFYVDFTLAPGQSEATINVMKSEELRA